VDSDGDATLHDTPPDIEMRRTRERYCVRHETDWHAFDGKIDFLRACSGYHDPATQNIEVTGDPTERRI
jgi:hypothetical protein